MIIRLIAAAIVGLSLWLGYSWWSSPERAIKKRLAAIADTLSIPATDTDLARVARVARLRGYLAEAISVRAGSAPEIVSRDAALAIVGRAAAPPGGLAVRFDGVRVTVNDDAASARVALTAKVYSRDPLSGQPTVDERDAHVGMAKRDGEWVVASVETAEPLRRPGQAANPGQDANPGAGL